MNEIILVFLAGGMLWAGSFAKRSLASYESRFGAAVAGGIAVLGLIWFPFSADHTGAKVVVTTAVLAGIHRHWLARRHDADHGSSV